MSIDVDGPQVGGPSIELRYCGHHELLCRQTILFFTRPRWSFLMFFSPIWLRCLNMYIEECWITASQFKRHLLPRRSLSRGRPDFSSRSSCTGTLNADSELLCGLFSTSKLIFFLSLSRLSSLFSGHGGIKAPRTSLPPLPKANLRPTSTVRSLKPMSR